jgi:hypothetical protein
MKFKKKAIFLIGSILAAIIIISGASYAFASNSGPHKYSEPQIRPSGLPPEAKFNPDRNEYYDSSSITWDSANQRYVANEQPAVTNITAENLQSTSREDWIIQHKDSTDPTDIALIKYQQAIEAYTNEHPEVGSRSDWGVDYSGELTILTDLGVVGLPGLVREVDANSPFIVPVIIAIDEICKTDFSFIDTFSPEQVTSWKLAFNNESNNAKDIVAKVVETLKNNASVSDEEINNQLADAGIFALPYFYDEVINHSNIALLKYADKVLPNEKLKEFHIGNGSQDSASYRKALTSCISDINIINNLGVK